jgi:hypothetical protein
MIVRAKSRGVRSRVALNGTGTVLMPSLPVDLRALGVHQLERIYTREIAAGWGSGLAIPACWLCGSRGSGR